jgi:2,3,4,5-tetrahydropyridine-2-carboxylate N-succinyltransferase
MDSSKLQAIVDNAWEERDKITAKTGGELREAVETALRALDAGDVRVAEKTADGWQVNQWLKKAVLLSFRLSDMKKISGGPGDDTAWWDKVDSKFAGWGENRFRAAGFRACLSDLTTLQGHIYTP